MDKEEIPLSEAKAKDRLFSSLCKLKTIAKNYNRKNNCIKIAISKRKNYKTNIAASFKHSEKQPSSYTESKKALSVSRAGRRDSRFCDIKPSRWFIKVSKEENSGGKIDLEKSESNTFVTDGENLRVQSAKQTPEIKRFQKKKKEMSLRKKSILNNLQLPLKKRKESSLNIENLKKSDIFKTFRNSNGEVRNQHRKAFIGDPKEKSIDIKINRIMEDRYGKRCKLNFNIKQNFQPWKLNKHKKNFSKKIQPKTGKKKKNVAFKLDNIKEEAGSFRDTMRNPKKIKRKMKEIEKMLNSSTRTFEVFALGNGNRPEFSYLGDIHKKLQSSEKEKKLVKYKEKKKNAVFEQPMSSVDLWSKDFFLDVMEEGKFLQQKRRIENYRDLDKRLKYINHYA